MWIRSQDKTILINTDLVIICGKNDKGEYPIGTRDMDYFLGYYSTKEKALKVLDMIEHHINDCCWFGECKCGSDYEGTIATPNYKVFQMPPDSKVE